MEIQWRELDAGNLQHAGTTELWAVKLKGPLSPHSDVGKIFGDPDLLFVSICGHDFGGWGVFT